MGVNRGAVREALTRLAQAGLIAVRHGGTTRVLDFRRTGGLDLLPRLVVRADGRFDPVAARGVIELRATLAPDLARLAAARGSSALSDALGLDVAAMADAGGDVATLYDVAVGFWARLADASSSVAHVLARNSLQAALTTLRPLLLHVLGDELRDVEGYAAVVVAVGRRDIAGADGAARELVAKGTRAMGARLAAVTGQAGG
jgi:DNA-binding FadR family transcriptional regulator